MSCKQNCFREQFSFRRTFNFFRKDLQGVKLESFNITILVSIENDIRGFITLSFLPDGFISYVHPVRVTLGIKRIKNYHRTCVANHPFNQKCYPYPTLVNGNN